jgi:hypothetical protein
MKGEKIWLKFEPVIRGALEGRTLKVKPTLNGYTSINSLYVLIHRAINFATVNIDPLIRSRVRVSKSKIENVVIVSPKALYSVSEDAGDSWKDKLLTWLENAKEGDIYELEILLTEEEKKWVEDLLKPIEGCLFEFKDSKLRIMR